MIHPTKDTFKKDVIQKKGVTIVDFYADWCGPCKILGPIMEKLDKENNDSEVAYAKINVDENQELAGLYGVMSIPTVVFFKDGKVATQKVGVHSEEEYKKTVETTKQFDPTKVKREVTIFSTPTCPYCKMVKDYLTSKKIPFKEIDVTKNQEMAREMINRSGEMGVPQLWINDQVVMGFNKPVIDMLLGL